MQHFFQGPGQPYEDAIRGMFQKFGMPSVEVAFTHHTYIAWVRIVQRDDCEQKGSVELS